MAEVNKRRPAESWPERNIRTSTVSRAIAQHVFPPEELTPTQETLQERINELYEASDKFIAPASERIRDYIRTTTAWEFDVAEGAAAALDTQLALWNQEKFSRRPS